MKYLFSFMLIGLFAISAMAQKPPTIELVVKGIKSETDYPTIVQKLGKPKSEDDTGLNECTQGTGKSLSYEGLEITVEKGENDRTYKLLDMKITSSKWLTDKGIKIGATPQQVIAKYGKTEYEDAFERPTEEKVFTGEKWLVYEMKNGPGDVTFYFKNDRLVRIELEPTIC